MLLHISLRKGRRHGRVRSITRNTHIVSSRVNTQLLIRTSIAQTANASPEGAFVAARTPGPACASADGKVVVVEGVEGGDNTHQVAEEDIEAVVAHVIPTGAGDKYGNAEGEEGEDEEVDGGSSSLTAKRLDLGVVLAHIAKERDLGSERGGGRSVVEAAGASGLVEINFRAQAGREGGVRSSSSSPRSYSGRRRNEGDGDGELAG